MRFTQGQLMRYARKISRIRQLINKYNFDSGKLQGKTKRRLMKWMNAFNKLTRGLVK